MKSDWAAIALFVCLAAVVISLIAAITYDNVEERRTMVRAGMCEVFKDPPLVWVWEKCQ